jgi:hypothetical protein
MTTTGDVAKGILIFFCGYFLLIAIGQAMSGRTLALGVFMLGGFTIPLSYIIYDYIKDRPRKTKRQP